MKTIPFIALLGLLLICSCTKPPDYPDEPVIEFSSWSKTNVVQGQGGPQDDFTYLILSFTDGDGDLGSNDNNQQNAFLSDTRIQGIPLTVALPKVPEQGAGNGISGEIQIKVPTSCCEYQGAFCESWEPVDTLIYEVYIMDRAGNESNRILTDPLYLLCQ